MKKEDLEHAKELGLDPKKIKCWSCFDGEYAPYYGMAPHSHLTPDGKNIVTSTLFLDIIDWPNNFEPDKEPLEDFEIRQGTWYCSNLSCHYSKEKYKEK